MEYRTCTQCGIERPVIDFYNYENRKTYECKKCAYLRQKHWVKNNKESRNEIVRRSREKHREERNAYRNRLVAKDKLENGQKYKDKKSEWVIQNPEKVLEHNRISAKRQSEELRDYFVLRCMRLKYAPPELIDLKRISLKIKRQLKEMGYDHNN